MSELLLEIVSGEIPAGMQKKIALSLADLFESEIEKHLSKKGAAHIFWTARRIGFCYSGFEISSQSSEEEVRGPKTSAPDVALEGFLKKHNISKSDLYSKDDYYFAKLIHKAIAPQELLEPILKKVLATLTWPKSMKWQGDETWVRPIYSILALLDGSIINFEYGNITASNTTLGHRVYSNTPITVNSFDSYKTQLKENFVVLSEEDRKTAIVSQASKILELKGLRVVEDTSLLDELVGLSEYPTVILSSIPERFMSLPREILTLTLKTHQRYLMVEDRNGKLAPYYCIVSNINPDDKSDIISGNDSVLTARLEDATFFFENDLKSDLDHNIEKLKNLTYHNSIGSYHAKQASVEKRAIKLAQLVGINKNDVSRAIWLAKADLVSHTVKEMPELQGIIGYYLARNIASEDVAIAVRDHYKPQGPHDSLPSTKLAACVALSDKLDTIDQMFANGIKPTGSKDPYALRRAALGIIRIAKEFGFNMESLLSLIENSEGKSFIQDRLKD